MGHRELFERESKRQGRQKLDIRGRKFGDGVEDGVARGRIEGADVEFSDRREVMVAGDGDNAQAAHPVYAFVGLGAVADNVPHTSQRITAFLLERLQNRVKGVEIAVNVAEDAVAHLASRF